MTAPASAPRRSAAAGTLRLPGMRVARVPDPLVLVIFGATGDLTRRKLLPALFRLFAEGLLPERFEVLGVARSDMTEEEFRAAMRDGVEEFASAPDADLWNRFAERLGYFCTEFNDAEGYRRLSERLESVDRECGTAGNRLFYLAIPPGVIAETVTGLADAGMMHEEGSWRRIVVEKPFGRDLGSAHALNAALLEAVDERQLFRIDHYLGKETVQNLLVFRFANVIWEPVWNRNYVDHVQITVAEDVGVGTRAGYYDRAGALRDMVQSHLLQLLTLVAMEPPAAFDAEGIRNEKQKVLRSVRPIPRERVPEESARGRYAAGADGAPGYTGEPGVASDSRTETYAALRLWIDNWRWADVPFYLRTGKRLPSKVSEIAVRFRPAPHPVLDPGDGGLPEPNLLVLRIQPEEGISLFFEAKVPGLTGSLRPVSMDFGYCEAFGVDSPEAYERLLLDAMLGDATLFARRDETEAAWALVSPVLERWAEEGEPEPYRPGSWGPASADALLARDGRYWRAP